MNTFTARIKTPTGTKIFGNCVIYKEKLAQQFKKGVGEAREMAAMCGGDGHSWEEYDKYVDSHRPLYNKTLIEKTGLSFSEFSKLDETNQGDPAFNNEILRSCMLVMGENPNGYFVFNNDEEKARKEQEETNERGRAIKSGEMTINFKQGIFGYETERLPREIWSIIQPFGTYHKGDEADEEWADDMGYSSVHSSDLRGWFYHKGAMQALLDAGYRVSYRGKELTSEEGVQKINEEIRQGTNRHYKAAGCYELEKKRLREFRIRLYASGEDMKESETEILYNLPTICFHAIGASGADIYGGGVWFHVDDNFIYVVQNNGRDGDYWAANNYRIGGAGAIARRVKKTEEVEKFLSDAREFENKKVEDFYAE